VNAVQASPLDSPFDRPAGHPELEELRSTDHAVLPTPEIGDCTVPRSRRQFSTCEVGF
jgi:hypothetical protein